MLTHENTGSWRTARRHAVICLGLAWCAFVLVPAVLLPVAPVDAGTRGTVIGLVPVLAGCSYLLVLAVGELTWPRPTGAVRRAALAPRGAADVVPRGVRRATWWLLGVLTALLAVTSATAAPDGRSVFHRYSAVVTGTSGPYPGLFYAVPLLVGCLVVLLGGEVVLRLVARRPGVSGTSVEADLALRRASGTRALVGVQATVLGTLSGVLTITGSALHSLARGGTEEHVAWLDALGTAAAVAGPLVLLAVLVVAVVLTGRGDLPRMPRDDVAAVRPDRGQARA